MLRQNQFGFVLGGPIYIPKVYDGRNKTFWLVNYEGWRIGNGAIIQGIVPTPAELGGDFSATGLPAFDLTPGSPCQVALTNPTTAQPCLPGDPATGAGFPGGIIPTQQLSRASLRWPSVRVYFRRQLRSAWRIPMPAAEGSTTISYKLLFPTPPINKPIEWTRSLAASAGSFSATRKQSTKTRTRRTSLPPSALTSSPRTPPVGRSRTPLQLGTRNINNFRVGYLHAKAIQGAPPASTDQISALGVSGVFTTLPPSYAAGFPTINFQGALLGTSAVPAITPRPVTSRLGNLLIRLP